MMSAEDSKRSGRVARLGHTWVANLRSVRSHPLEKFHSQEETHRPEKCLQRDVVRGFKESEDSEKPFGKNEKLKKLDLTFRKRATSSFCRVG